MWPFMCVYACFIQGNICSICAYLCNLKCVCSCDFNVWLCSYFAFMCIVVRVYIYGCVMFIWLCRMSLCLRKKLKKTLNMLTSPSLPSLYLYIFLISFAFWELLESVETIFFNSKNLPSVISRPSRRSMYISSHQVLRWETQCQWCPFDESSCHLQQQ